MPFISIGIIIIGGLVMGIYHMITFDAFKAKQAENQKSDKK
jgi:predicted nucleic-acid-binding protein